MSSSASPAGLLERLELGRPRGYWEGHLADGRKAAVRRLLEWMEPLAGHAVLDAGCGRGIVAVELARRGARVLACDRQAARALETRRRAHAAGVGVTVLAADLAELAPQLARGATVWCWELFEHQSFEQRRRLLRALEAGGAEALFFGVRVESRLAELVHPLLNDGDDTLALPTLDPVALLREIHLETDLRLERTETLRRRNSAFALAGMRRPAGTA